MYFVLPDLAFGNPRKGFDTLSATFERGQLPSSPSDCNDTSYDGRRLPAFVNAPRPGPSRDILEEYGSSKYAESWDMVNLDQDRLLLNEPLSLSLSILGGPRTRHWDLAAASVDLCIERSDNSRLFFLPTQHIKPGQHPWALSDDKPCKIGESGVLLWHPDSSVASPLRNFEHYLNIYTFKLLLRIRLVNAQRHWRDVLLTWRFAPGCLRLQPHSNSTPVPSPTLSTCTETPESQAESRTSQSDCSVLS